MLKIGKLFIVKQTGDKRHPFYLTGQFNDEWYEIPTEQRHIKKPDPFVGIPPGLNAPEIIVNAEGEQRVFEDISRDSGLLAAVLYFGKWLGDYVSNREQRVLKSFEVDGGRIVAVRYQ